MENNTTQYYEDEIDLRKLAYILLASKKLVIGTTILITFLAGIYAFNKTPTYEASALVEIGNYKLDNNNNNNKLLLDSAPDLVKKLNILFIELYKNEKGRDFKISSISTVKNSNKFIEIKAQATSNQIATREATKVVENIQARHQVILNDIKNRRELEIRNVNTRIDNIKNKEVPLLLEKIKLQQVNLHDYKSQLDQANIVINNIENTNPALTALKLMEKRDLSSFVVDLNLQLMDMRNNIDRLEITAINDLIEQRALIESMLMPHNYKNSTVIGRVVTSNHPVAPKKKLIVAVAFIASLMLSIFLVFLLNAFKQEDEQPS